MADYETGHQMESLHLNDDLEHIFTREDGPRPAVRSADDAVLHKSAGWSIAFILALR